VQRSEAGRHPIDMDAYRGDHEAALARVDALERELARREQARVGLEAEVSELRRAGCDSFEVRTLRSRLAALERERERREEECERLRRVRATTKLVYSPPDDGLRILVVLLMAFVVTMLLALLAGI
jgi:hypothetical protein